MSIAYVEFPLQIKPQYAGPVGKYVSFDTYALLLDFISNPATSPLAYSGQIATCKDKEGKIFVLNSLLTEWIEHDYALPDNVLLDDGSVPMTSGEFTEISDVFFIWGVNTQTVIVAEDKTGIFVTGSFIRISCVTAVEFKTVSSSSYTNGYTHIQVTTAIWNYYVFSGGNAVSVSNIPIEYYPSIPKDIATKEFVEDKVKRVATVIERDAIHPTKREWRMVVGVYNDTNAFLNGQYELVYNRHTTDISDNQNWRRIEKDVFFFDNVSTGTILGSTHQLGKDIIPVAYKDNGSAYEQIHLRITVNPNTGDLTWYSNSVINKCVIVIN